ncbi:MAG: DUF2927 domain-containing protein [Neomegalonema sp.]|nr:DUF2927 domain-containing protein [Neomegalonema sp.]
MGSRKTVLGARSAKSMAVPTLLKTLKGMRLVAGMLALGGVSACASMTPPRATPYALGPRPIGAITHAPMTAGPVHRANASLARDLIDLTTMTEHGEALPGVNKLETPIEVGFNNPGFEPYRAHLQAMLANLRHQTGVEIYLEPSPVKPASRIRLRFEPRGPYEDYAPEAMCFFNDSTAAITHLADRKRQSGFGKVSPPANISIYIPLDLPPHDVRTCFYEEILQGMGPLNDLFRLPDSIFNDENSHLRPTKFDLLMLKALYDPRIKPGMSREQAEPIAREILAEINPAGEAPGASSLMPAPDLEAFWRAIIDLELSNDDRRIALEESVRRAKVLPVNDYRRPYLDYSLQNHRAEEDGLKPEAYRHLLDRLKSETPKDELRRALLETAYAFSLYEREQYRLFLGAARRAVSTLELYEHDDLVANLRCSISYATFKLDGAKAARPAVRDCLNWSRYAYGDDSRAADNMRDVLRKLD